MKATLSFSLPDEQEEFDAALDGMEWKIVVSEISDYLRAELKYKELTDDQRDCLEQARDVLLSAIDGRNLSL